VARSVPIQVIGDHPGGVQTVPADCSRTGAIQNTQALLGANGILGVGLFRNDCAGCISPQPAVPATYYSCSATGCVSSSVTASQVVQNPVARFLVDNNGVVITLPAVAGSTNSLSGTLTFGIVIGTQTNNALGNATVYGVNPSGNFTTTYNNTLLAGYIDSGSNAFFFNDPAIPKCTITNTWAYCPSAPLSLSATNQAANGSPSKAAPFSIVNADQLPANVVAANIGAPSTGSGQFAWGLPFFYGKTVFTAIEGMGAPGGTAPYWAY
jgi:hypothetical protein